VATNSISVNWASLFANGTLSAASAGTTWNNAVRLADHFLGRLATTAAASSGLTQIKVDQGATASAYLSANRLIIPASHNIGVALTLEYNSSDSWAGSQTAVTLSPSATPTSGTAFSATFTKVTAAAGNQWWRLSFTKTDAAIQIGELWLTEKVTLGQSETTAGEDGQPDAPADFPIHPNIAELRTLEGVRTAVELGPALRRMPMSATSISANSLIDWNAWLAGIGYGLKPFYFDDPIGATWFAQVLDDYGRSIVAAKPADRWELKVSVAEIP